MDLSETNEQFPRPPLSVRDKTGKQITIKAYSGGPDPLVQMYLAYDEPATRGLPPQTEDEIREWLKTYLSDGLNVVARHNWRVLGHAALLPHSDTAELVIFVHPDEQSNGIGTQLIQGLLGYGQERDMGNVWLSVSVDNLPLFRIATAVGFKPPENSQIEFRLSRDL